MKTKYYFLLTTVIAGLVFCPSISAKANMETFTTGKEWLQKMSVKEKFLSIFAPSLLFHKYGVPLRRPIDEYIPVIDKVLLENPYLEKEEVANIFASTVYTYEPESRPALDSLERRFRQRRIQEEEFNESLLPRLIVRTTPKKEYESSLLG